MNVKATAEIFDPFIIASTASLAEALDAISVNHDRHVIVVEDLRVVGVCSEGDAIRAYRRGILPQAAVTDVMERNPVLLSADDYSDERIVDLFIKEGFLIVPVVDDSGRLLRVARVREILSRGRGRA